MRIGMWGGGVRIGIGMEASEVLCISDANGCLYAHLLVELLPLLNAIVTAKDQVGPV